MKNYPLWTMMVLKLNLLISSIRNPSIQPTVCIPGRFSVWQKLAAGNNNFSSAINNWVVKEVGDYIYGTKIHQQMGKVTGHYT